MKLVMDEKLKHRLIGLAVIISLAAIFAPAILHKSNQNMDAINLQVALPPKPTAPEVVLSKEKDLFKTVKIAKVDLQDVPTEKQLPQELKAEILTPQPIVQEQKTEHSKKLNAAIEEEPLNPIKTEPKPNIRLDAKAKQKSSPTKTLKTSRLKAKTALKKEAYAIQLASFTRLANAQSLINRLETKGYKANLSRINTRQGAVYKVSVGNAPNKTAALRLKNQLANLVQLNGFIIPTGVS